MSGDALRHDLQALLAQHMPSMDHVAVLLAMWKAPIVPHTVQELALVTGLDPDVIERVARDLAGSRLVSSDGETYRYEPRAEVRAAVDELAAMYHTKPVTLVRLLYDRPPRAVQSFSDAFRVRKSGN